MDKTKLKKFYELTRGYTLLMSVVPFIAVFILYLVWQQGLTFAAILKSLICLIGIVAVHMFANLFDDYIDIQNKLKDDIPLNKINFKSKRKARLILNGEFSIDNVEKILIALAGISALVGLFFVMISDIPVISYIILGGLLTVFYPFSAKFGLSELTIALIFGPLLMNGAFYALTSTNSSLVFSLSMAFGLMISILSITHSIMDYEFDKETDKKTLPVMLGKEGSITLIEGLIIIAHIISLVAFSKISPLFGIISILPLGFSAYISSKLIMSLIDYINIKEVDFTPKWYLGIMENWEEIKANNYEYYMYRFYLARNLAAIFGLSNIIVLFIYLIFVSNPILTFIIFPHIFNITNIVF